MKNLKVVFYSPPFGNSNFARWQMTEIYVNPTPYYLHSYFMFNYPDLKDRVNWAPSVLHPMQDDELISYIENHGANVFCASIYLWNIKTILKQIEVVRNHFGDKITIVVGGPSCEAVKEDWHVKYPFIDHFVVGQGEKAWSNLVLQFLNIRPINDEDANIVHFVRKSDVTSTKKTYNYEFVRGIHFSPYVECENMVVDLIEYYNGMPNINLAWIYETARGCPFHCTFCDWNGGQSNKTQKRKINFIDDVDFMAKHKMHNIYLADANFGMWEDDLKIVNRMIHHNENGHKFKFYLYNLNKNFNDRTKEIFELIVKNKMSHWWIKLSTQDINQDVLDAIDRPGAWKDQKEFAHEMYKKYNKSHGLNKIFVETIVGLPMQTLESYTNTLDEIYGNGFIPRSYPFMLLPNAPASYDMAYREKYKIVSDQVFDVIDMKVKQETVEEVFKVRDPELLAEIIISTSTATEEEIATLFIIDQLYRSLMSRSKWPSWGLLDKNWTKLKELLTRLMETEDYKLIRSTRLANFKKYRINAMNSAQDKIMTNGVDMHSLISRNWDIINDIFHDCEDKDTFFEVWQSYSYAKDYLDFDSQILLKTKE